MYESNSLFCGKRVGTLSMWNMVGKQEYWEEQCKEIDLYCEKVFTAWKGDEGQGSYKAEEPVLPSLYLTTDKLIVLL